MIKDVKIAVATLFYFVSSCTLISVKTVELQGIHGHYSRTCFHRFKKFGIQLKLK